MMMSFSLSSQFKDEQSDANSNNDVGDNAGDDAEFERKINVYLSNFPDIEGNNEETIVQTTIPMPHDLRISDKCNIKNENKVENVILENSPMTSSKKCNGIRDEDIYMITDAGPTLPSSSLQITSIDGFFNRKRGRPPKNRFIEVYKNTHQKPQAIFTSFKLERQGTADSSESYDNVLNYSPLSNVETLRVCENDGNNATEKCRQKPIYFENTTHHRKRSVKPKAEKCIDANDIDDNDDCKQHFSKKIYDLDRNTKSIQGSATPKTYKDELGLISFDSASSECKKSKMCGTTNSLTVIRAAGTYFPENVNHFKSDGNFTESLLDQNNDSCSSTSEVKDGFQLSNLYTLNNEVCQNLSLKNNTQGNSESPTSSVAASFLNNFSVIPQIYNVLQMQQQLFAFYQQIALMNPNFSHKDLKSFLAPTEKNMETSMSKTSSSTFSTAVNNTDTTDSPYNTDLPNHQKQNICKEMVSDIECCRRRLPIISEVKNIPQSTEEFNISSIASQIPSQHLIKDVFQQDRERTPLGYSRFRFNEDCGYDKCGYRQHQSHFHCNRNDCQYSFCDKTRFVQHTARHERLDTLMGNDFRQYRATMLCTYINCPYAFNAENDLHFILNARKSSHFHCLKCTFVCTDTNKVVAHRRLHSKMEFIRSAGFRKVTSNENCLAFNIEPELTESSPSKIDSCDTAVSLVSSYSKHFVFDNDQQKSSEHLNVVPSQQANASPCPYAMRHAHYHCLSCNSSVLSRSQLLAHKHRKASETATENPMDASNKSNKSKRCSKVIKKIENTT